MNDHAKNLLSRLSEIEAARSEQEAILRKTPKGLNGITPDSAKTDEWRQALALHAKYFKEIRDINSSLNKIRKHIGFENINGRRVPVYKYKDL